MQTKQFTGTSVDEVLKQIRAELGDEAVIIQTRRVVRGGIGGFFGKELIEVTAADGVDDDTDDAQPDVRANRAAAASVLDVHDEDDDLPNPFARHLQTRMSAAGEAETDPAMGRMRPDDPAPASPAGAYARNAPPPGPRPFAASGPERTQAIIEAARQAMRTARAAREGGDGAATGAVVAPARTPGTPPAPPEFIPAHTTTRSGMRVIPDRDDPGVGLPVWERVDAAAEAVARSAPSAAAPAPAPAPVPVVPEPPAVAVIEASSPVSTVPVPAEVPVPLAPPEWPSAGGVPARATRGAEGAVPAVSPSVRAVEAVRGELLGVGVDAKYLDPFLEGFTRSGLPFTDVDGVRDGVRRWLASRLPAPRDWKGRPAGHALAFVGQSGVGKSTVVAKLAWRLHEAGQSVALVSAGAAPDRQLADLARRLGLTLAVAHDADALARVRAETAGHDVLLIDTHGCSHKNLGDMEDLGRLLGGVKPEEVHLVLPVAVQLGDLGDVSRRFRLAGVNRLTVTKLDETRFLGNLVNVPLRMVKPLALVGDGPAVPGGLVPADPARVAELLLP